MGQASLATFYVVFAIFTIYLNLESIGTWDANAIYRTISKAISENPFSLENLNTTRFLDEVQDPEQVYDWMRDAFRPVLFGEQEDMSVHASWQNMSSWTHNKTPPTIGSFNRILLVRFTFKRWAVQPTIGQFQPSTPYRLAGGVSRLDAFSQNAAEDKTTLCVPGTGSSEEAQEAGCFQWETGSSFDRVGGFTSFFDPMWGSDAYDALLQRMKQAGLFDMRMGTCTVDMIVYNANVEMFLQYVQSFAFDFSGHGESSNDARSFNLNVFNTSVTKYLIFYIIRVTCVVMLIIFLLLEFRRIWDLGFFAHFRQQGAITDMVSITVSLGVFLSYWIIEQMQPFRSFNFADLQNSSTMAATYVSLCDVARSLQIQGLFIAANLLVVSLRTVSLVSGLHSNLGLILKVIHVSGPNFIAFLALFGMLQIGFVLTSFFAFGPGYSEMSDIGLCIYKSFSMLSGDMIFDKITRVDPILGPIYFFSFYILFFLVLINIFVTLLMSGYDIVDYELHKKGQNEVEKNPIILIFEELKADVVGNILKYGSTLMKYIRVCVDPIVVSIKACCCISAPPALTFFSSRALTRGTAQAERQSTQVQQQGAQDPDQLRQNLIAFTTMVAFMAVWICLMTLQGRGSDSYFTGQTTLSESALEVMFYKNDTIRNFDQIHSFSDVKTWADTAIVGLYSNPTCAESTTSGSMWNASPSCANSNNSQQLLNRIGGWNVGFLNTTFVRLTIQPACFVATESKWASGLPTLRKTPDVSCWNSVCTDVFSSESCRSADGDVVNAQSLSNAINSSLLPETFSFGYDAPGTGLGPFKMLGGLSLSLGVTKEQCEDVLALLDASRWFTENSASIVFDWLTYNGNMDLFTHSIVAFSLLETGVMRRSAESRTFPMNVDTGGGYFDLQTLVLVLFGLYVALLLYHIIDMIRHVAGELAASRRRQQPLRKFFVDYWSEGWNVIETLSLLISLATVISFLVFVLNGFRTDYRFSTDDTKKYVVPNEQVKLYNMQQVVDPSRNQEDDWYFFRQFEIIQGTYGVFLEFAALNSLFIALKTVKIVNRFKIVSKFSNTLANGKTRNLYFIIVINLQMAGFALAMTVVFGTMVQEFSSPLSTMGALLYWVCGSSDLRPLMRVSPTLAVLFFVAFMVVFRFISTNMFLATQLNTFAALVGESDIKAARLEANAKMGMKQVRYHDKKELQAELELERQSEDQVTVKRVLRPGLALQANVQPGDVVSKVNKQKVEWQNTLDEEEYEHIERALVPEPDGTITLMFQDPPRKTFLAKLMQSCSCMTKRRKVKPGRKSQHEAYAKPPAMRPTVHNFWRFHGAVAEVEKDSQIYRPPRGGGGEWQ
ncbi:unnamed protein product [Durusdinium trenchii]|uniref:Polycystin-2 (Curly up) (Cup) (Polycystic kidney disease 2 protein homolog) (Transient receptor potential cation channel subfamily P member 2) n=2 Tax=Durusdinium trenchii TaxID=1381693 RepID=A0ABP0JCZ7_9DINO